MYLSCCLNSWSSKMISAWSWSHFSIICVLNAYAGAMNWFSEIIPSNSSNFASWLSSPLSGSALFSTDAVFETLWGTMMAALALLNKAFCDPVVAVAAKAALNAKIGSFVMRLAATG